MNQSNFSLLLGLLALTLACAASPKEAQERPNIVLIMADDIGYSDIGCYGSEIQTPNLDRLAEGGLRLRQFYNMAKCETTRASMISGLYRGDERAVSFVPLLRAAGYSAMMSGKEHFAKWIPEDCYFAETFENAFTFWATTEYFVPPRDTFQRPFFVNGEQVHHSQIKADLLPKYKTDFITDYALDYLDIMADREDPFFLCVPYHAAHYPLQARPADIEKYRGKYLTGWDEIRASRFAQMQKLGIISTEVEMAPPSSNTNAFRGHPQGWEDIREKFPKYYAWHTMSEEEKQEKDLEMAVFAAMIDRMDQNIGRIIDRLEDKDALENTLIIFFTDNGSCPFDSNQDFDTPPGPAEGYRCLSAAWATVGNTPFRLFKQNGHEGGARTHFIAHWPDRIPAGKIVEGPGHVVDLYPTFLDLAQTSYPEHKGSVPTIPLDGTSLLPIFTGDKDHASTSIVSGFRDRFRSYREDEWKLVRENGAAWELYNIEEDPTEINDLAGSHPEKVAEMEAALATKMALAE
ncbi:MAG: arylsulfatase [Saprospiraceae bacterium]|nr:arylsulfatase [Saprospiraceae bacterium]